jgi:hypothetical protein
VQYPCKKSATQKNFWNYLWKRPIRRLVNPAQNQQFQRFTKLRPIWKTHPERRRISGF